LLQTVLLVLCAFVAHGFLPQQRFKTSGLSRTFNRRSVITAEAKLVTSKDTARQNLIKGINVVCDVVKVTLGPKGRNVVLERGYGAPQIVNDGVTIAKAIELKEPQQNVGVKLIQEVARQADSKAGDGTTTSTVMAQAFVNRGMRMISAGANPVALRRGMMDAVEQLVTKLKEISKPVSGVDDLRDIATVSVSGDVAMGQMIARAVEKVGESGSTIVEESQTLHDEIEFTEGYTIDRGFVSPYFIKDQERQMCEQVKPRILVTDRKIDALMELVPLLEGMVKAKEPLFIVCEDLVGEALSGLVVNKLRGVLDIVAIKAPGFGTKRTNMLQDIAIATGATFVSEEVGVSLKSVTLDMLGFADRVMVGKDKTTIVTSSQFKEKIDERVLLIRQESKDASEYEKEKAQERAATLGGGIARIKVGAATETELKDKKLRYEDAINAVKSAVEMGVVPGGGSTLAYLARFKADVKQKLHAADKGEDYAAGVDIVFKSLTAPMNQISENAGVDGAVVVNKCLGQEFGFGYNAATDKYEDMVAAGILDPCKVTINALETSVSIASMVLTTEAVVTAIPDDKSNQVANGPDYSGM
jgi:chaperonin GroEL